MSMHQVIIGFGSNIDPERNVEKAKRLLAKHFEIVKQSDFVITKPVGYVSQPDFLNGAVMIGTELEMAGLKDVLREIERKLGRTRDAIKYGPRTIDLDIVVWDGKIIDQDFYARDFVKNSTLQLMPDLKY